MDRPAADAWTPDDNLKSTRLPKDLSLVAGKVKRGLTESSPSNRDDVLQFHSNPGKRRVSL